MPPRALRVPPLGLSDPAARWAPGGAAAWAGAAAALPPPPRLSVALAVLAVALQLLISSNVLVGAGIAYNTPGGNPLIKFHPSTYLVALALLVRLAATGRPLWAFELLVQRFATVALFLAMIVFLIVYSALSVGPTGTAILVESYAAAGLLWLVLGDASPRQKRALAWVMLWLFFLNDALGVAETLVRRHVTPMYLGAVKGTEIPSEFRGLAFYDHALTGAMMTQMALFLLLGMRLGPVRTSLFGLPILVGLLGFGGRTALLVSIATLLGLGTWHLVREAAQRTLRPRVIVAAVVGVAVIAALGYLLLTETSIGVRIAGKLSFHDNSTAARSVQWLVPGLMDLHQLMFGLPLEQLPDLVFQLGLALPFHDVENFWLLAFITLGAVGFVFYLVGFLAYLGHVWRVAPRFGRVILVSIILVASTSNSLGRKSNILFVMTASVLATTGFVRASRAAAADPSTGAAHSHRKA